MGIFFVIVKRLMWVCIRYLWQDDPGLLKAIAVSGGSMYWVLVCILLLASAVVLFIKFIKFLVFLIGLSGFLIEFCIEFLIELWIAFIVAVVVLWEFVPDDWNALMEIIERGIPWLKIKWLWFRWVVLPIIWISEFYLNEVVLILMLMVIFRWLYFDNQFVKSYINIHILLFVVFWIFFVVDKVAWGNWFVSIGTNDLLVLEVTCVLYALFRYYYSIWEK